MATVVDSNQPADHGWIVNCRSDDLSGCEELRPAVAGKSHYLESLYVSAGAAITVSVGEGDNAGALTTPRIGPLYMAANSNSGQLVFARPIKMTAATALTVDASGAGNVTVVASGYTK